jgi:hypothetical protein
MVHSRSCSCSCSCIRLCSRCDLGCADRPDAELFSARVGRRSTQPAGLTLGAARTAVTSPAVRSACRTPVPGQRRGIPTLDIIRCSTLDLECDPRQTFNALGSGNSPARTGHLRARADLESRATSRFDGGGGACVRAVHRLTTSDERTCMHAVRLRWCMRGGRHAADLLQRRGREGRTPTIRGESQDRRLFASK